MSARILIADDEESIRFVMRETLEAEGHVVTAVGSGDAALAAVAEQAFDIAFFDIRMPGPSGLDVLDQVQVMGVDLAVVIITAQNTFENAVDAMKRGAFDYLVKPFSTDEIVPLVEKAMRTRALESEVRLLRREVGQQTGERLVGRCPAMLEVFKIVGRVSRSDVPILVQGESGTGKELIARAIHSASPRGDGAFITVNAAAIPRDLLESELFGHERGAFTGAVETRIGRFREAAGGTLFLDEIGDMPIELQAKLLRVLQDHEVTAVGGRRSERVDVRIVAATHRDLDRAVADGTFREDLLYRLRVVPIELPPLRERAGDIPTLIEHFLNRYDAELTGGSHGLAEAAIEHLVGYDWPGNVRELENAVKRALVLASGDILTPEDFEFLTPGGSPASAGESAGEASLSDIVVFEVESALAGGEDQIYRDVMTRVERPLLETVLARTSGNQIKAAAMLGINRNTLRKKITELAIEVPKRP